MVVSDINEGGGRETVRLISEQGGSAAFFRADVGVERDVGAVITFSEENYGGVDILVNNAGPYFHAVPLEKWFETIQANLMGTAYGTLRGIEAMRKRGGGAFVNFSSTSAIGHDFKPSSSPAYDAAKAGITRLTTMLAWLQKGTDSRELYRPRLGCDRRTADVRGFADPATMPRTRRSTASHNPG